MTQSYKLKIAEQFPFCLMVIAFVFYILCGFDFYASCFDYLSKLINCCLCFCFFAWLNSDNWGFVAKRSLLGLVLLNILDLFYTRLESDLYFHLYSMIIFYSMIIIFIYDFYAFRKSKRPKKPS